jgi:hypothetical protein
MNGKEDACGQNTIANELSNYEVESVVMSLTIKRI